MASNTPAPNQAYEHRLIVVMIVLAMVGAVLVGQLVRWQIIEHDQFKQQAEQRRQEVALKAKRGDIFTRNGNLLAIDSVEYEISASPHLMSNKRERARELADLLEMPYETMLTAFTTATTTYQITNSAPREVGEYLLDKDYVAFNVHPRPKRAYPEGSLAAHVLGIVIEGGNGFYGVEGFYNSRLKGTTGIREGELGPFGLIPLSHFKITPPVEGTDLYLTIDRAVQRMVERELAAAVETYGAEGGTILVMNPRTGEVLALANYPTYDPNKFATSDTTLFNNSVVSIAYEPGSVFKLVTMAAALDSGQVQPGSTVNDTGAIDVGGQVIYNSDRLAHGTVDMTTVLAKSLNVSTAQIAVRMGPSKFYNYLSRFGFGRITEIDLDSEGQGTLKKPGDPAWHESDLATNSFGQGIAVTPIQMLTAICAIANDGYLMKPYIVQRMDTPNSENDQTNQPQVVRRAITVNTAHILTEMMLQAGQAGDSLALIPGYEVAGKTGTSQIPVPGGYHPDLTIASYAGFFPANDPQVAALVILNKPTVSKWGSQTAAPTFRKVGEQLINLLDIPPASALVAQQ